MKITKLLILVLLTTSIYAQDYRFGKVSKKELQEKFHPLDSAAEAAYLIKERKTYYRLNTDQDGFDVVTEFFTRIKIYNKDGFNKGVQILPYYHPENGDDEKISSLRAFTFNLENGKVKKEKLKNDNIFNEEINKFWSQKKVTMPNVNEGSVIDIKYTLVSPYFYKIDDLNFQYDIPVKKIYYSVVIPEFYKFKLLTKGFYPIAPQTSKKNSSITITSKTRSGNDVRVSSTSFSRNKIEFESDEYIFISENIPALRDDEPYVANVSNYRGGVELELTSTDFIKIGGGIKYYSNTWEDVSKQIFKMDGFGKELNKKSFFQDDLSALISGIDGDFNKVAAVFQFVKSKVKWNGYYGKTADNGVRKAYKEGAGNAADINLMLTSMLREAGLEANPVLISTRNNGIPLFPTLDGFNYVITMVEFSDNTYVLLDATEPYSLPNILPTRDLNWNGRKVAKDGSSGWVRLMSNNLAIEENFISVKISEELLVKGIARTKFENLNAVNYRANNNHISEESIVSGLESKYNIEIDKFKIMNKDDIDKPISTMSQFISEDLVERISNKLYIKPLLFLAYSENPFKLEERKYPVDFATPWQDTNKVSIQIPKGYRVESVPETMAVAMPNNLGVFKYQVAQSGNKVITASVLEFNNALIGYQHYSALKKFYSDLVSKQSEKIVLIKE